MFLFVLCEFKNIYSSCFTVKNHLIRKMLNMTPWDYKIIYQRGAQGKMLFTCIRLSGITEYLKRMY